MGIKLFDMCSFSGFYKKVHDGRFIHLDKNTLTANLIDTNLADGESDGVVEKDCDRAEKKYFEHVKANGKGVVVGFIDLVVVGYLDVIYNDACDVGVGIIPESFYVTKSAKETAKCAIVYYSNNKKHYVPLCDIKLLESEDSND
jgi:hypothetical protein